MLTIVLAAILLLEAVVRADRCTAADAAANTPCYCATSPESFYCDYPLDVNINQATALIGQVEDVEGDLTCVFPEPGPKRQIMSNCVEQCCVLGSIAPGTAGTTGTAGTAGTDGGVGLRGSRGFVGSAGSDGAAGSRGSNGLVGVGGAAGAQGSTGVAGVNGALGVAGTRGTSGSDGLNGAVGAPGVADGLNCAIASTSENGLQHVELAIGAASCTLAPLSGTYEDAPLSTAVTVAGAVVRLSTSFSYRRVSEDSSSLSLSSLSESDDSTSASGDQLRCGPHFRIIVGDKIVYEHNQHFFEQSGTVNGFVDVLLPRGMFVASVHIHTLHCNHGAAVQVENLFLTGQIMLDNQRVVVSEAPKTIV